MKGRRFGIYKNSWKEILFLFCVRERRNGIEKRIQSDVTVKRTNFHLLILMERKITCQDDMRARASEREVGGGRGGYSAYIA